MTGKFASNAQGVTNVNKRAHGFIHIIDNELMNKWQKNATQRTSHMKVLGGENFRFSSFSSFRFF